MKFVHLTKMSDGGGMVALIEYPRPEGTTGIRVKHPDGKVELLDFVPRPRYGMRPVLSVIGKNAINRLVYHLGMKFYAGPVFDFIPETFVCDMQSALAACWDDITPATKAVIVGFAADLTPEEVAVAMTEAGSPPVAPVESAEKPKQARRPPVRRKKA